MKNHSTLAFCVLVLSANSCLADPVLDRGLADMAKKIHRFMQSQNLATELIVGDFTAPPRLRSSGGTEISRSIRSHLTKAGIKVHAAAEYQLLGKFFLRRHQELPEDDFESHCLEIEATILDGQDQEIAFLPLKVFGNVALHLTGQTVDLPPKMPENERQRALTKLVREPQTFLNGSRVRSSSDSPFEMEVLVAGNGRFQPRMAEADDLNRGIVELFRGEEYAIRLHNNAPFDAAVDLTIDGVAVFVDAEDVPKNSKLIVRAGKSATVPGWYITNRKSKAFEIGGYEDSVAGRLGQSHSVGTVTAVFRACWEPGSSRPSDEPSGNAKGGRATKQGRDIAKDYRQVTMDFGHVRSIISVRYER